VVVTLALMDTDQGTTNELKIRLINHIAGLLDDLEMNDTNEGDYTDQAIIEMHERNKDLAGFLVGSMGLSDTAIDEYGYVTRVNLVEPNQYVDQYLK
jgi:hypothetical protein